MIDKRLVEKKLRRIEEFMREIEAAKVGTLKDFKKSVTVKRFIERNIELAIEQMVDVCKHIVSVLDLGEPETYSDCLAMLSKKGVIKKNNLETFQSMVRFRNLLIHAYDGVDDSITYGIYKKRLGDFGLFIGSVRDYLKKKTN